MKLNGKQLDQLNQALCNAFTHDSLARMVRFGLDERLNVIASGEALPDITFSLISWAEQYGRLADLIAAASEHNPNNPDLKEFISQLAGMDGAATVTSGDAIPQNKPAPNARLADAQATFIQAFYAELRSVEKQLNNLYYLHMPIGMDPPEVDIIELIRRTRELELSAEKHSIYFSAETSNKIQSVCAQLSTATRDLEYRETMIEQGMGDSEEAWEAGVRALDILNDSVPPLLSELDKEFRSILGFG